jgi:hypothetical protein
MTKIWIQWISRTTRRDEMNQNFTTIPFKAESGMSKFEGVAKFSGAGVVFEFESKLFGIIANGVKQVQIPLAEILDVKFRKGIFKRGARIEMRMKNFSKLSELPYKDGKLTLKLERDDFERGEAAVLKLQKDMSGHADSLPPVHTPVSELFGDNDSEDETRELN